ncbi:MAG: ABC-2 transporter permease [Oscillospiraceae bacterium]|nr:ABC-2 transporter permease [Oscillospiraceae bacterium]
MNKSALKGLLLYDFYCVKKVIVIFVRIFLITFVVGGLLLLSTDYGNLKVINEDKALTKALAGIMVLFAPMICGTGIYTFTNEKFLSNQKTGWNKYLFSLPVSDKLRVATTYAYALFLTFFTFFGTIVFTGSFYFIAGDLSLGATFAFAVMKLPIAISCIVAVFSYINIAISFIFKNAMRTLLFTSGWGVLILYSAIYAQINEKSLENMELVDKLNEMLSFVLERMWLMPILLITSFVLSYIVSLIAIKWRDKL